MTERTKFWGGLLGGLASMSAVVGFIFMLLGPVNALENAVNQNTSDIASDRELSDQKNITTQQGIKELKDSNKEITRLLNQILLGK